MLLERKLLLITDVIIRKKCLVSVRNGSVFGSKYIEGNSKNEFPNETFRAKNVI